VATVATPLSRRRSGSAPQSSAISIDGVSKTFRIPHDQLLTLKERVLHPASALRASYDELRAVDDMSFDIREGEFFGIVGRNGSGKSTLLKCIAGIYDIDRGNIGVRGRLSPFIELGVGFNLDLTARDNVIINAIMLGLTRQDALARFDQIIAFAELEDFVDLRLKNYSSGMYVRLAFSVAIQVDADILLIDEVLAVGDANFQQKCFAEFKRLKAEGRTIVFVTHDMYSVQRYCDRAMLIDQGRMVALEDPASIARRYNELNFGRLVHEVPADAERFGDQRMAEVRDAWFEDGEGARIPAVAQRDPLRMCMEVEFHAEVENPVFAMALRNEVRHTIFATTTERDQPTTGTFSAGERTVVRVEVENWLAPSLYTLTPSVARAGGTDVFDVREDLGALVVHGTRLSGGVTDLPHRIAIERR
jgi:ABC-type polysaccharide/polyol phosphate transport system ATPase subunit